MKGIRQEAKDIREKVFVLKQGKKAKGKSH